MVEVKSAEFYNGGSAVGKVSVPGLVGKSKLDGEISGMRRGDADE